MEHSSPPEFAEYIASKTRKFKDVRMSIRTARVCQDEKEVDRCISIVEKWRSEETPA